MRDATCITANHLLVASFNPGFVNDQVSSQDGPGKEQQAKLPMRGAFRYATALEWWAFWYASHLYVRVIHGLTQQAQLVMGILHRDMGFPEEVAQLAAETGVGKELVRLRGARVSS